MTPNDIVSIATARGIKHRDIPRALGIPPNTWRKWKSRKKLPASFLIGWKWAKVEPKNPENDENTTD